MDFFEEKDISSQIYAGFIGGRGEKTFVTFEM